MKILCCIFVLLFSHAGMQAHAGFVTVHKCVGYSVAIDSPEVRQPLYGHGRRIITSPKKQMAGAAALCFVAGLLAITGAITLLILWPVPVGVGVALAAGTLAAGTAAILLGDRDGMNIKPSPELSVFGSMLGFIAILPIVFPISVCLTIYAAIKLATRKRMKRRQAGIDTAVCI